MLDSSKPIEDSLSEILKKKPENFSTKLSLLNGKSFLSTTELPKCSTSLNGRYCVLCTVTDSEMKISASGETYCSIYLSNLNNLDLKLNLLIFSKPKGFMITQGSVISVIDPKILNFDDSKKILRLSVANKDKIVDFGLSTSFGKCSAKTKDGSKCKNFVNIDKSTFCDYHVIQGYRELSKSRPAVDSMTNFFMPKKFAEADMSCSSNETLNFKTSAVDSQKFKEIVSKNNSFSSRQILKHLSNSENSNKSVKSKIKEDAKSRKDKHFEDLLNAKSQNSENFKALKLNQINNYFDKLYEKEKVEVYLESKENIVVSCYHCRECKYTNERYEPTCKEKNHTVDRIQATKYFFKCSNCSENLEIFKKYPTSICLKCGSFKWKKSNMLKKGDAKLERRLVVDDLSKLG